MARTAAAGVALLLLVGCAAPGGAQRRFQSRPMPNATVDTALIAARTVLEREYGDVQRAGRATSLVTAPLAYEAREGTGTARDLYRGRSAMRELAYCEVVERGGTPVVLLRVELQRRDTTSTRTLGPERRYRLGDQPSYTPIEEDAATTEAQNEVWTLVRRDTQRERDMLVELQNFFAGPEPEAAIETQAQPASGATTAESVVDE